MTYRLYRHYNAAAELLYVGISLNTFARLAGHRDHSAWFAEISHIKLDTFQTKEAALEAEKIAIQKERPKFNIRHNWGAAPTKLTRNVGRYYNVTGLFCSIDHACARWGCSRSALYDLLSAGKIRALTDGRWTRIVVASGDAYFGFIESWVGKRHGG
jgi:hypothetical protein